MVTIFCTGPLRKRFGIESEDESAETSSNVLGAWYATVVNVGSRRLVVWLNAASNLTVITRARKAEFPDAFPAALEEVLLRIGIPPELAARERAACSEFRFATARDRSLLGSLRDAVVRVRLFLEDGRDPDEVEDSMAEMPARHKAFLFPREVAFARFGLEEPASQLDTPRGPTRPRARPVRFTGATPILRVNSIRDSIDHYVSVFGFRHEWDDGQFGCVSRGDVELFLCEGSQGCAHTWVYVSVSDVDALFEEYRKTPARIRRSPVNYPWGAREMHVFDPDGHVLRFGSDAVPGEPWGEWIDEQGVRWQPQSDGSWVRVNPEMLN